MSTRDEEIQALRAALIDLLGCTELQVVCGGDLEPETLQAIERASALVMEDN